MNHIRTVLTGCLMASTGLVACEGRTPGQSLDPTVHVAAGGVEIAEVPPLPDLRDPEYRWTWERRTTIATGDESDPAFYELSGVVQLSPTRLVAFDSFADQPLLEMDIPSGTVVRRMGHRGQGPGELGSGLIVVPLSDSAFRVFDISNRQRHEFVAGIQKPSQAWRPGFEPTGGAYLPGSGIIARTYLEKGDQWNSGYMLLDLNGDVVGPFAELPKRPADAEVGSLHRGRALDARLRSQIVTMWSSTPELEIHGDGGRLIRRIRLPLSNRRVSASEFEESAASGMPMAEPGSFALTNMLRTVNDTVFGIYTSDLWRAAEDPGLPSDLVLWRLFSSRGRYLGTVEQPDDYRLLGLGEGTIWARLLNEETFLPELVELKLVPPVS